jgi:hypothetical protein
MQKKAKPENTEPSLAVELFITVSVRFFQKAGKIVGIPP